MGRYLPMHFMPFTALHQKAKVVQSQYHVTYVYILTRELKARRVLQMKYEKDSGRNDPTQ